MHRVFLSVLTCVGACLLITGQMGAFKTLDEIIELAKKGYISSWHDTISKGDVPTWQASVSQEQFVQVANDFVAAMTRWVKQIPWVGSNPKVTYLFKPGVPFVQKISIAGDKRVLVAVVGDLHADIATTAAFFKQLERDGYLLADGTISPKLPNNLDSFYIACLGDYLDRGSDSVGTLTLLLHVATKNPGHVLLLRGNHDNTWLIEYKPCGSSKTELVQRYGEKGFSEIKKQFEHIKNFFPSAVYLGQQALDKPTRYMIFCHGILDFGFNAQPLLESTQDQAFGQYEVDHKTVLRAFLKNKTKKISPRAILNLSLAVRKKIIPHLFHECDLVVDDTDSMGDKNADFVGVSNQRMFLGQNVVHATMQLQSTPKARIYGVMRGHQHDGGVRAQPMAQAIFGVTCDSDLGTCSSLNLGHAGVSKLWGDSQSKKNTLWEGCVCTFGAAPDINLGHMLRKDLARAGIDGDFAAYGLFSPTDWTLQVKRISLDEIEKLTGMRIQRYGVGSKA